MTVSYVTGSSVQAHGRLDAHISSQTCHRFRQCAFPTVSSAVSCSQFLLDTSLLVAIFPASRYASLPIFLQLMMVVIMRRSFLSPTYTATIRRQRDLLRETKQSRGSILRSTGQVMPKSEHSLAKEPKKESD